MGPRGVLREVMASVAGMLQAPSWAGEDEDSPSRARGGCGGWAVCSVPFETLAQTCCGN